MEHGSQISPRERILTAVIECIERDGISNLTTRLIVREAGTNIAAINYYFRSKDALVSEALQMSLDHMLEDVGALLSDPGRPLQEALREVFLYLVEGAVRFPGISMANLYSALVERQYDSPGAQAMRQIFRLTANRIAEAYPEKNKEAVQALLHQVLSTVLFSMLAPGLFQPVMPVDFDSEEGRRFFVGHLLNTLETSLETIPGAF
jgi:AcrR family transcriptional regulator